MALAISNLKHLSAGVEYLKVFDATFDSSYPDGGEPLDLSTIGLFDHVSAFWAPSTSGYVFDYDKTNNKILVYRDPGVAAPAFTGSTPTFTGTAPAGVDVDLTDLDAAASTGVAVYAHVDEVFEDGTIFCHLEAVSPTDTDILVTATDGGPTFQIIDDDAAASGGFAVYFDEDATAGSRLLANIGADAYVPLSNGDFLKITADASPGTAGVQIYVDEDASNAYEKLLFVSPTDTSGTETTSASISLRERTPEGTISQVTGTVAATAEAAFGQVDAATNLSSLVVTCSAIGV